MFPTRPHRRNRPRRRAAVAVVAALAAAGAGMTAGCAVHGNVIRGNGVLLSETRDDVSEPFDAVSLDGAVDIDVTVDPAATAEPIRTPSA